ASGLDAGRPAVERHPRRAGGAVHGPGARGGCRRPSWRRGAVTPPPGGGSCRDRNDRNRTGMRPARANREPWHETGGTQVTREPAESDMAETQQSDDNHLPGRRRGAAERAGPVDGGPSAAGDDGGSVEQALLDDELETVNRLMGFLRGDG